MIKVSVDCEPNSHATVRKISKTSLAIDWGWKPVNIIIVTTSLTFQRELLHERADRWVGVDVEVAFCFCEKKNARAAVDDVTDDVAVYQSKFWGQSLSGRQQVRH